MNEFTKEEWMATYGKVYKALIDGGLDDFSIVREVLLSGATEVECLTNPPPVLCDVLKKYFGSRTAFRFS